MSPIEMHRALVYIHMPLILYLGIQRFYSVGCCTNCGTFHCMFYCKGIFFPILGLLLQENICDIQHQRVEHGFPITIQPPAYRSVMFMSRDERTEIEEHVFCLNFKKSSVRSELTQFAAKRCGLTFAKLSNRQKGEGGGITRPQAKP